MSDMNDVSFKLGQMDGKLDLLLEAMKQHVKDDNVKHDASDERIGKLEKKNSWLMGASAVISLFFVSVWEFLLSRGG
jgi:hypothetical protein